MRMMGCFSMVVLLAVLTGEAFVYAWLARAMDNEWLGAAIAMILLSVAGYRLLRWRGRRMAVTMMGGDPGRAFVHMFGALLIVIPGFATGAIGLLLQLPPVGKLFAGVARKAMMRMAKAAAGKMGQGLGLGGLGGGPFGPMAGGGSPFAGGGSPFAGGGVPGFPFGAGGLKPDDGRRFKGKTIDTTAEK